MGTTCTPCPVGRDTATTGSSPTGVSGGAPTRQGSDHIAGVWPSQSAAPLPTHPWASLRPGTHPRMHEPCGQLLASTRVCLHFHMHAGEGSGALVPGLLPCLHLCTLVCMPSRVCALAHAPTRPRVPASACASVSVWARRASLRVVGWEGRPRWPPKGFRGPGGLESKHDGCCQCQSESHHL